MEIIHKRFSKETPLTRKQIKRFVKKINYGTPIKLRYIQESKKDLKNPNLLCAQAGFHHYLLDKKTGAIFTKSSKGSPDVMTVALIEINKRWKKHLWNDEFKAVLLHEVGHFFTGFSIVHNKIKEKAQYLCEFEAQKWALKRSKQLKMRQIHFQCVRLFHDWAGFEWKSPERIYLRAYKLAIKKGIIKAKDTPLLCPQ